MSKAFILFFTFVAFIHAMIFGFGVAMQDLFNIIWNGFFVCFNVWMVRYVLKMGGGERGG